jgi:hypothetical protein
MFFSHGRVARALDAFEVTGAPVFSFVEGWGVDVNHVARIKRWDRRGLKGGWPGRSVERRIVIL